MKRRSWFIALCYLCLLAGCASPALPTPSQPAPTSTPRPTVTATLAPTASPTATRFPTRTQTPTISSLNETTLKSGTYRLPFGGKAVKFVDGAYESGTGADYLKAFLLPQIAFGDLDGDGIDDAAVLVGLNYGESDTFVYVYALRNWGGESYYLGDALIDDRPRIDSLAIQEGKVIVSGLIHGPEDKKEFPSWNVRETFQFTPPRGIALTSFSTMEANGWREISIIAPLSGSEATGSVRLQGSMTTMPYENDLCLVVYSLDKNDLMLTYGPFFFSAEVIDGAVTFDYLLDLSSIPVGKLLRLEVFDSTVNQQVGAAMDSVTLRTR